MMFPNSKSVNMKIATLHSCDFRATVAIPIPYNKEIISVTDTSYDVAS
jgi:hypothetical protein